MPHISNFQLNGVVIPSVNECTDSLSKDGLMKNFFRRLGFKEADRVGNAARRKGTALATRFENLRKFGKPKLKLTPFQEICIANWQTWMSNTSLFINPEFVERHLVNTVEGYHGSPDVIMADCEGQAVLGDDKAKKRLSDYKILMNEHAYAMCDSYEVDGVITPVPWDVPIRSFWLWTYHHETGDLYPEVHHFEDAIWQDFLTCKKMLVVNQKAEKYFATHCQKLPEAE